MVGLSQLCEKANLYRISALDTRTAFLGSSACWPALCCPLHVPGDCLFEASSGNCW